MQNILEVKNLTVNFNNEKVIDNLSFNLKKGENLVVVGPNGAGKTVLLRTLIGMIPFEGEIKWEKDVKIGYVPQKILPEKNIPLSIEEFFNFKKIDSNQIVKALKSVGINDLSVLKKKIGVISSGQLQRILIAWSLIGNPEILLFDEPLSGIDIEGEETIYNLLSRIEKERDLTIILITHDLSVVYKFADSVLCLNKESICYGPPQEALTPERLSQLYGGEIKLYKHDHH
ncbi:ABC transporter ATP-binding protein [Candidatus Wolfebacteria bacterium CG18_big_fil_WC_8_21_14_2_50_39_7]|uniref:ABC transporter ATP-binding protein n=3 Tax=Candidatus Wolfeibacteriota TaxID=1752735 RepID=A0A2H0ED87_9BACT|nr:metal ABC transporter ATP-binding protein [Candidatus Wolfebacteria bacterium]OIO65791.1 MAG: ABC transporter ATP-binding protein [Candidatus Wolfebacteria bacterium CG1_02_39_135]PIP92357.1 MAG: ABC transporter ATP-binding protein [Candidatus Wolfebacteria bacterium CG18_big_fil_WC_8_21_14_2_50_39_7]